MLQVDAVYINIADPLPEDVQDTCTEVVWTRFVEAALAFPHLRYVELLRRWNQGRVLGLHEPAFLGITDAVFKPLIDSKKFLCLFLKRPGPWEVALWAADTVNPKGWKKPADREAGPSGQKGDSRESRADKELEGAVEKAEESTSEHSSSLSTLAGTDRPLANRETNAPVKNEARHEPAS